MQLRVLATVGILGVIACSASDDAGQEPSGPAPSGPGTTTGTSSGDPPAPPTELPAPTAVAKTLECVPGTTVTASLETQGVADVTFEITTQPTKGTVNWIDAKKGELVYRPKALDSAVGDEFTYVVKGNGKTSAPAKVTVTSKALDFTGAIALRGASDNWYSYNLAANFNNAGTSSCGDAQQLMIVGGKLLERVWPCGTYPEIAVGVGAGSVYGGTPSVGGSFRRVTIARRQFDARLEYREESTDCTSYNSTLKSCNAGESGDLTGRVYLGAVPTTTTAPVIRPTTCETTGDKLCYGIFAASDTEGDVLSFEMTKPANGQAAPNDEMKGFAYQAKPGFVGTDSFTVVVSDGIAKTAPTTITIVVK